MPWMETSPVEQRERFIRDHRLDLYAMAELCARYGVSRKTGYKWLARFEAGGTIPTLPVLERLARALDADVEVRLTPRAPAA